MNSLYFLFSYSLLKNIFFPLTIFKATRKLKEQYNEQPDTPHTDSPTSCHTHFPPLSLYTQHFLLQKANVCCHGISPRNTACGITQKEDILLHRPNTIIIPKKSNIDSTNHLA